MATYETKTKLHDDTLKHLQELIQMNIDSHECLLELADKTDVALVANLFRDIAAERMDQNEELRRLVAINFEEPESSGSFSAAARRMLIDIRAALGGGVYVMLIEAEKAEDAIKDKYEKVIKETAGSAVSDVLHRQFAAVKAAHDRVKAMRDNHKT